MRLRNKKILVIEDDDDIREVLQEILELEGAIVATAENGSIGYAHLQTNPQPRPDVILVDLMMPRMNGEDFTRTLQTDGALNEIPIVLMSADLHIPRIAEQLSVKWHIKKPVNLSDLVTTVSRAAANE